MTIMESFVSYFVSELKLEIKYSPNILFPPLETPSTPAVQNELIHCTAKEIMKSIIERVLQGKWYSILFDEPTDVSHHSQLTFSVRIQ